MVKKGLEFNKLPLDAQVGLSTFYFNVGRLFQRTGDFTRASEYFNKAIQKDPHFADAIAKQNPEIKTLCVPKADETTKMKEMFGVFLNMIDRIKEYEELDRLNDTENRCSEDCT